MLFVMRSISSRFTRDSEVDASELLENLEEMFHSTTHTGNYLLDHKPTTLDVVM